MHPPTYSSRISSLSKIPMDKFTSPNLTTSTRKVLRKPGTCQAVIKIQLFSSLSSSTDPTRNLSARKNFRVSWTTLQTVISSIVSLHRTSKRFSRNTIHLVIFTQQLEWILEWLKTNSHKLNKWPPLRSSSHKLVKLFKCLVMSLERSLLRTTPPRFWTREGKTWKSVKLTCLATKTPRLTFTWSE